MKAAAPHLSCEIEDRGTTFALPRRPSKEVATGIGPMWLTASMPHYCLRHRYVAADRRDAADRGDRPSNWGSAPETIEAADAKGVAPGIAVKHALKRGEQRWSGDDTHEGDEHRRPGRGPDRPWRAEPGGLGEKDPVPADGRKAEHLKQGNDRNCRPGGRDAY